MYSSYPYQAPGQRQNMEWIMAPTIQQVEQVMVQPGQKAWIMVQNEPIFALRTADNMGLIQTDYYKFEKFTPNASSNSFNALDELEKRICALEKMMGGNGNESAGVDIAVVNRFIKQFEQSQKAMKQMQGMMGKKGRRGLGGLGGLGGFGKGFPF